MATDEPQKDTPDEEPEWLEPRAAADFLGISERRLNQLRRRGEIPGTAVSWRRWRFRVSDLMTYVRRSADRMTPTPIGEPTDTSAYPESPVASEPAVSEQPRMTVQDMAKIMVEIGPAAETETYEEADANKAPIVRMANAILVTAIENDASEIHLEPDRRFIRVRMRIDGIMHEMMAFPPHIQAPLFQRYKVMADCRPLARNIIQRGRIPIRHGNTNYDLVLDILPSQFGESIVLKIYRSPLRTGLNTLGMSPETQAAFEWPLILGQRLVLLVSPKNEGATTTAYVALNKLNHVEWKTFAIEEVSSYRLSGIFHVALQAEKGLTWRTTTQAALRQSADTIFLGDLTDAESAEAALFAAESGVRTLATLTAPTIPIALSRLSQWGISRERLFPVLGGLLYQRLVRCVCTECATEYEATLSGTPDMAQETVMLRQGVGCDACRKTGYRGRIGVFEMLYHFPDHLERPFSSLAHDLRGKVYQGITSVEEAQRLLPYVRWIEKPETSDS
jgi:type IV pilus assembly protein PilB